MFQPHDKALKIFAAILITVVKFCIITIIRKRSKC